MTAKHWLDLVVVLLQLLVKEFDIFGSSLGLLIKVIFLISTQFGILIWHIFLESERSFEYRLFSINNLILKFLSPFGQNSQNGGVSHIKNFSLNLLLRIELCIFWYFSSNQVVSVFHNFLLILLGLFAYKLWSVFLSYCFITENVGEKMNCFNLYIFLSFTLFIYLFLLVVWLIDWSKNTFDSFIEVLEIGELFVVSAFYFARLRLFSNDKIQKFHYLRSVVVLSFEFELNTTLHYHIVFIIP